MNFKAVSDDEEEEDVGNDMMVDAIQPAQSRPVNQPNPEATAGAEDGWVQVTSRRSRGTRN